MDIFLVCVGLATLFFAGTSFVFARQSGDWKDYSMSALQVMLSLFILGGVANVI